MNNQELNVIKPHPEGEQNNNVSNQNNVNNQIGMNGNKKKNNIILIVACVLVVVLISSYFLLFNKGSKQEPVNKYKPEEKITFESDYEWANKYGNFLQDNYNNLDKYDIAFVQFDNDDIPELVINYTDEAQRKATNIIYIKNNEVLKTKTYNDVKFYLITPLSIEDTVWYLYLGDNKYGKYTIVTQLIDGTALDASIKATNDTEKSYYANNYVHSEYQLTFYEIEKSTMKDDYMTKVNRYESDKEKIDEEIDKLGDKREQYIIDNNIDITQDKTIKLHTFTLELGEYVGKLYTLNGDEFETTDDYLTIDTLNTLTYHDKQLKFTVAGDTITCEDGTVFNVVGNNQIQIMDEVKGPITYMIPEVEEESGE